MWSEETPPIERVYAVVFGLSYPVDASYIADQVDLSPETTRAQLEQLCELNIVEAVSYSSTQLYSFADSYLSIRALHRLCTQRTPEELSQMATTLADQIETWQQKYDISSPQAALNDTGDHPESSTPPPLILGEWLFLTHYQTLIQKAQVLLTTTDESPTDV
jgi:predicted ArsR family transcriptional regulator